MAKRYTPNEKNYIEENYLALTDTEMGEALGRDALNIKAHRKRNGLNRYSILSVHQPSRRQTFRAQLIERELTPEEEADIIADLKRGFKYGELAADYGVPAGVVKKLRDRMYDLKAA